MISQERLKELLDYDPLAGIFVWRVRASNRVKVGDVAGNLSAYGYRLIRIDGRMYMAHRLAWLYMTGTWPDRFVDHKNMVRDDNRWCNLRAATMSKNKANAKRPANNTSGFKGVHLLKRAKRYWACITVNGETKSLGCFSTPEAAHRAYMKAAEQYFGEFANAG